MPSKTNPNDFVFFFLGEFDFLEWSKFNHTQRDCTCACVVACLHQHNSISNVSSLTIHDNEKKKRIYLLISDEAKNMKPVWKVKGFFNRTSWKVSDVQIGRYTWVLVAKDNSNQTVADSLRSAPQENWNMLFSISSQTQKRVRSKGFFG